ETQRGHDMQGQSQQPKQGQKQGQSQRGQKGETTGQAPQSQHEQGAQQDRGKQGQSQQRSQGQKQHDQTTGQSPRQQDQQAQPQRQQGQQGQSGQQGQMGQQGQTGQQGQAQQGQAGGSVNLTTEQRTKIRQTVLTGGNVPRASNVNFSVNVGTVVPTSVRVVEVPSVIVDIHPQWRGFWYFVVGDEIIIVDRNHKIVAILAV